MEIIFFDEIDSTHNYLLKSVKNGTIKPPTVVYADVQSEGVGSRSNSWISLKGNLFFSVCVDLKQLPDDLPKQSICIYFSYIFKDILSFKGSKIWLKWPNDFYIDDKKIGGAISAITKNGVIFSLGLNLVDSPEEFGVLDICCNRDELIDDFIKSIENIFTWKQVFSKYKIEFQKSKSFDFHYENRLLSLKKAVLNYDGSVTIGDKRVFNVR